MSRIGGLMKIILPILESIDFQKIHIKVNDYAKNEVNIQAIFSSDTIPIFDYSVHFINDTCFIKYNTEELYKIRLA